MSRSMRLKNRQRQWQEGEEEGEDEDEEVGVECAENFPTVPCQSEPQLERFAWTSKGDAGSERGGVGACARIAINMWEREGWVGRWWAEVGRGIAAVSAIAIRWREPPVH
jgi:hypothetical protein